MSHKIEIKLEKKKQLVLCNDGLTNCASRFIDYGCTNSHCFVFMLAKEEKGHCLDKLLIVQPICYIIFLRIAR